MKKKIIIAASSLAVIIGVIVVLVCINKQQAKTLEKGENPVISQEGKKENQSSDQKKSSESKDKESLNSQKKDDSTEANGTSAIMGMASAFKGGTSAAGNRSANMTENSSEMPGADAKDDSSTGNHVASEDSQGAMPSKDNETVVSPGYSEGMSDSIQDESGRIPDIPEGEAQPEAETVTRLLPEPKGELIGENDTPIIIN